MCFPETLRATGGIETPFTCMAPCSVTMPVPAHPQPPSPPTPPLPNAWHGHRNLSYACKHQNAAWLQFLGLNIYA